MATTTPTTTALAIAIATLTLDPTISAASDGWRCCLLEAAPKGLDVRALKGDLVAAIPGMEDVHHMHAWSLTEDKRMVTLMRAWPDRRRWRCGHGIDHATVEVEGAVCGDAGRG